MLRTESLPPSAQSRFPEAERTPVGGRAREANCFLSERVAASRCRQMEEPLERLREKAYQLGSRRGFAHRLREAAGVGVIAEIKFRSPSAGEIRPEASADAAAEIARQYEKAGATCLSVLTEPEEFAGDPAFLWAARAATGLPVLRKDFLVELWQIWESAAMGADAVLLIVAALEERQLIAMAEEAKKAGLDVLVEVHDRKELRRVLKIPALSEAVLGFNNRSLSTLEISPDTATELCSETPAGRLTVAASGYGSPEGVQRAVEAGIQAFLTGESLMRAERPGQALRELFFSEAAS